MKNNNNIPKIPHAFFKWYCRGERYEEIHGDLEEFYYERIDTLGSVKARLYYMLDVIRCCQPYAWKKPGQNSKFIMFRNFYFTATRNLLKNKSYALLNTSGLIIGLTSFIFIALYIANELSYDRFHPNDERIYRVKSIGQIRDQEVDNALTCSPLAKTIINTYPEVERITRIRRGGTLLVGKGTKEISEEGILYADSNFFDVFGFALLKGNPKTALVEPRSMILTESYAQKYFGFEDPIGQTITVEHDTVIYTITGVTEDVPTNSHIQFDMLGSMASDASWDNDNWIGGDFYTYAVVRSEANIFELQKKMKELVYTYMAPQIEYYTQLSFEEWEKAGNSVTYDFFPTRDIHLYSTASNQLGTNGNISYIYIYAIVGLVILFIAIFNFVNLATAQSSSRSREVGVRKVMGSSKTGLVYQFIFESILVSLIATIMAVALVYMATPMFEELIGKELAFGLVTSSWGIGALIVLSILVGILAGCYPAFILSALQPAYVLKGTSNTGRKSGWLRNLLVVIQFAASIVIIISTVVVYNQINFMLTKNLGFDKDQVLVIRRPDLLNSDMATFKNDLLANSTINEMVNSVTIPGKNYAIRSYRKKGDADTHIFLNNQVSFGYEKMMGLELISGRFFSEDFNSDSSAVLINETAAKAFGFEDPIGEKLTSAFRRGEELEIIGVIKDYNVESLHKKIEPTSIELIPDNTEGFISVKLNNSQNIRETVEYIEGVWKAHSDKPFQFFFFDEEYEHLYKSESSTGRVFTVFAGLSILIACLGLIGLIAYSASVRKKEIGIRKVLGASTATLIRLLSSEIVRLILVATFVSWPLAYFATGYWLENFSDRLVINPWVYILPTLAVILIGGFAISFQTIKASLYNPIESLKQE